MIMKHGKHLKQFRERALRSAGDQESGKSKCQAAETGPEMEDLLERAEKALMPVYFPALKEDGLRQSDIRERIIRVSAACTGKEAAGLKLFFKSIQGDFGEQLACLLILLESEIPEVPDAADRP